MDKRDQIYLKKALNEVERILTYSENMTIEDFDNNPAILDGIIFRMIQLSEHLGNVSDYIKTKYDNISWINIKGFRNRLVHNYGSVDLGFVYNAIAIDIPELRDDLENL